MSADLVALALDDASGAALARADGSVERVPSERMYEAIAALERDASPRWVWWSKDTASALVAHGVRPARCWDLAAAHRLIVGGWHDDPGRVWATANDLDPEATPRRVEPDLFTPAEAMDAGDEAVRPDGHLSPDWVAGSWRESSDRLAEWATLALVAQERQVGRLPHPGAQRTVHSESAASTLCAELEHDGLPVDIPTAERIIGSYVGPRPRTVHDQAASIERLDRRVFDQLPDDLVSAAGKPPYDLRNPGQVKSMLRRVGIEVEDTRAWRLESMRAAHPIVDALLRWRKAERIRTTFGYHWLDEHVGPDGRLRGRWSSSDGAAGRMTATAGLHNLPAEVRPAIIAEEGHVLVRADLGQIEPRVLAAVSGDAPLARATADPDMYAPVAAQLGVEREVAKVAVLGAMYGQTTGTGAEALRGLERAYPVAMGYLRKAADAAAGGNDLRTVGGRLVRMGGAADVGGDARARAAARSRYGRNAMVQGAAAELFKVWAVLVRARCRRSGATIVLCLHDELLVHAPADRGDEVADLLDEALAEAAHRWAPPTAGPPVHFVADIAVVERWSDAK